MKYQNKKHLRNRRNARRVGGRRVQRYGLYLEKVQDPINEKNWNEFLKRVAILKKDVVKKVNVKSTTPKNAVLDSLVELVRIVTEFYDAGIPNVWPKDKVDTMKDVCIGLQRIVRRGYVAPPYTNKTMPGEKVNSFNLCIGSGTEIKKEDASKYSIVSEENGKWYAISVTMQPVSLWKQKRVYKVNGERTDFDEQVFINLINNFKTIIIKMCDCLLET